jgi:hypothetical protein
MNIPTTQEPKIEAAQYENRSKETENTKPAKEKPEAGEKKEDTKQQESDFKKLLEKDVQPEIQKALEEQPVQLRQDVNADYINKFNFDVGSVLSKKLDLTMNFDTASISREDAKFFSDLVDNKQFAIQGEAPKTSLVRFADEIGPAYKTQQTSKTLMALVEKAYSEQKPVRIDFDNNVSVIMKIDKKGKISAEFIPGDKAVEEYLRNNIRFLKQRFDEQNLPYNELRYRQQRGSREQNKKNNKGE